MDRERKNEIAREWYSRNRQVLGQQRRHLRRKNVAQSILEDARKSDRKRGRDNDLDLAFVITCIAEACSYCGEEQLRRTLDRIDNRIGHTRSNVLVACERCNYVRRDMPFEAWLIIANAMREARNKNLFGTWTGAIHRRNPLSPIPPLAPKETAPHGTLGGYFECGPPRCQPCKDAMADWKRRRRSSSSK